MGDDEDLWLGDREFSGSLPYRLPIGLPPTPCPRRSATLEVNKNKGMKPGFVTGNSSLRLETRRLSPPSRTFLERLAMLNSPDQKLLPPTVSKTRPPLLELDSSMEYCPYDETLDPTGNPYGPPPSPVQLKRFQRLYEYSLIAPLEELVKIMHLLDQWKENVSYTLDQQELGNPTELGQRPDMRRTLSVRVPSGGPAIKVKRMLLLTSFEEWWTYPICFAGSTVIQSMWKLKAPQSPYWQPNSGSPPTSQWNTGTRN